MVDLHGETRLEQIDPPTRVGLQLSLVLSSGGTTKRLDRLEAAGLIERLPDPNDRRGTLIRLSPKGLELINEAVPAIRRVRDGMAQHPPKAGRDIADAARSRVLLFDYPLAPEAPFPAAIDAITNAMREIRAEFRGVAITMAGDSAGGNLVVTSMLSMHAAGVDLPDAAACISPWADLARPDGVSSGLVSVDPIVTPEALDTMRDWYLAEHEPTSPLATPHLGDLSMLPPLLIQVGGSEVLLDDARLLAESARRAGVEVTLEEWPHMVHVWHVFAGRIPESTEAVERLGTFLHQRSIVGR